MLYPLKFVSILKPVVWGGKDICRFKNIHPLMTGIGESWEISDIQGDVSVVSNGFLQGKSLSELIEMYGEKLLGKSIIERFGTVFPLLVKFIDAKQSLSVQVHPNDLLAKKRHNSFGKTEMWYIAKAKKNAFLYSGFQKEINKREYLHHLQDNTIVDCLQKYMVKAGDIFFLPAGCVHAIGAGCFIVEIHQTSNITYRIYDYNRQDTNGSFRELHTELAKDAIDYKIYRSYQLNCLLNKERICNLIKCSYFTVNRITDKKNNQISRKHEDRFVIYICLQGEVCFFNALNTVELKQGETVLIPANSSREINLLFKESSRLLEVYIEISYKT